MFSLTGSCPYGRFRMSSDAGTVDFLASGPSSGQIYLAAGNWTSGYGTFNGTTNSQRLNCPWRLTLTATG